MSKTPESKLDSNTQGAHAPPSAEPTPTISADRGTADVGLALDDNGADGAGTRGLSSDAQQHDPDFRPVTGVGHSSTRPPPTRGTNTGTVGILTTPGPAPSSVRTSTLVGAAAKDTPYPKASNRRVGVSRTLFPSGQMPTARTFTDSHFRAHSDAQSFDSAHELPLLSEAHPAEAPASRVNVEQNDKNVIVHVNSTNHGKVPPLPKYGGTAQEDLDSWLDRVFTTKTLKRWSEADAFDNAALHLIGDAWNEFRVNKNDMEHTLAALSAMLRKRFQPVYYGRQCLQKFLGIKQTSSENARAFEARFRGALLKVPDAGLPESTILELFVNSLRPAYQAELERAQPTDLSEAFDAFRRAERIISPASTSIKLVVDQQSRAQPQADDGTRELLQKLLHALTNKNDSVSGVLMAPNAPTYERQAPNFPQSAAYQPRGGGGGPRQPMRCFACDSVLHKVANCPHKNDPNRLRQRFPRARQQGSHGVQRQNNPPRPRNFEQGATNSSANAAPLTSGRSANGWVPKNQQNNGQNQGAVNNNSGLRTNNIMLVAPENVPHVMSALVPVKIGPFEINALFDTGAMCSLVEKQLAAKLVRNGTAQETQQPVTQKLHGANGSALEHGKPITCTFLVLNQKLRWTFIPVENLQTPLLLGLDFMNHEQVVIDLSTTPNCVRFTQRDISVPFQKVFRALEKQERSKSVLFIKGKPDIIPPFETKTVQVEHAHTDPFALATRTGLVLDRSHCHEH